VSEPRIARPSARPLLALIASCFGLLAGCSSGPGIVSCSPCGLPVRVAVAGFITTADQATAIRACASGQCQLTRIDPRQPQPGFVDIPWQAEVNGAVPHDVTAYLVRGTTVIRRAEAPGATKIPLPTSPADCSCPGVIFHYNAGTGRLYGVAYS
jgi:hypothetical protein